MYRKENFILVLAKHTITQSLIIVIIIIIIKKILWLSI